MSSKSKSSGASSAPTAEALHEWATKIAAAQTTRDPAKVARARHQSDMRSRAKTHYKTASRLQVSNTMSSHAYAGAMRRCATVSAGRGAESEDYEPAYQQVSALYDAQSATMQSMMYDAADDEDEEVYDMRQEAACTSLAAELDLDTAAAPATKEAVVMAAIKSKRRVVAPACSAPLPPPSDGATAGTAGASAEDAGAGAGAGVDASVEAAPAASPALAGEEDEQEVVAYQLDAAEAGVSKLAVAASESNVEMLAQNVVGVDAAEMISLLDQLKVEPDNDEARGALFKLYEANQQTVQAARTQLFGFWAECEPDFSEEHAMVKGAINADMKKIDRAENMGVDFEGRHWFVHAMSKQVTKNNATIDGVLRMIRTKLELLGSQDECPVCFDALEGRSTVALGCAHACCSDCWDSWETCCKEQGRRPFCPLCKNEAFIESVCTYARA